MKVESSPEQEITTTEYSRSSAELFVIDSSLEIPFLQDHFEPIVDARDTLQATIERFKSPFFTSDETARLKLLDVVDLLTTHTEISKAMWTVVIDGVSYIYTFKEQFDETENLISVITYNIETEKKLELEEFKLSENVHMVTLQKTEQQVYIKTASDLHAEFVTLKESGIKVSGYNVRLNEQNQIEAEFGGKWYKLEDVVVKDSEMYLLLMQITKAVENGQTAFTVTTHGISAGTSKKFEIKPESAQYIINIFDVANGRVYNYILVDKSLEDVQAILAKYGIELNLENPDLTFGAVSNFNKEEFEKDNFGHSLEANSDNFLDFSSSDFELKSVIPSANSQISESLHSIEVSSNFVLPFASWRTIDLPAQSGDPESGIIPPAFVIPNSIGNPEITDLQEVQNKKEDETTEPKSPLKDGVLLIFNQDVELARVEFLEQEQISTRGVDIKFTEITWNVNIEFLGEQDVEVVNLEDVGGGVENKSIDEVVEITEIAEQVLVIETTKTISTPQVDIGNVTGISELFEQEEVLVNIVSPFEEGFQEKRKNIEIKDAEGLLNLGTTQQQRTIFHQDETKVAEQVVLLEEQFQSVESEHTAKYLHATVADFRWSNNLTEAEARAIQKNVEAKTGRTVIEIRTSPSGKLQVITI